MIDESTEELRAQLTAAELCQPPHLIGPREMLRAANVRPAWLVPDMVPARDLTLITGAPGVMKSWLAYDLARAVAQGGTWMGVKVSSPTGPSQGDNVGPRGEGDCKVLVLNFDNSTAECGRRFMRLGLSVADPIRFHSVDVGQRLRLPESAEALSAVADALRPSLIVIDSLRQSHTCDENSSKEMMGVMDQLKRLYACGAAVIVVHHSGKTPGATSKSRGSEEIDASATAVIHITNDEDGVSRAWWAKHRCWSMTDAQAEKFFRVEDRGDLTLITPAGKPDKKKGKREAV